MSGSSVLEFCATYKTEKSLVRNACTRQAKAMAKKVNWP